MTQGKYKIKNKAPVDVKKRTKTISARKNCPVVPTKWKYVEGQRIKKIITKNVNRKMEEEIRAVVYDTPKVPNSKYKPSEHKLSKPTIKK